ncbi:hypothetical protein H4219_004888 [Mycoemilia scoparia]|uniref:Uncharacterized protein n=1 Tax=Mycoemilia scoparia TaxID=417184 RepID=A0A9W7ZZP0_9FUNG|nr:hypothetical protein H4219_004888 [Mycoemilia scoparia]
MTMQDLSQHPPQLHSVATTTAMAANESTTIVAAEPQVSSPMDESEYDNANGDIFFLQAELLAKPAGKPSDSSTTTTTSKIIPVALTLANVGAHSIIIKDINIQPSRHSQKMKYNSIVMKSSSLNPSDFPHKFEQGTTFRIIYYFERKPSTASPSSSPNSPNVEAEIIEVGVGQPYTNAEDYRLPKDIKDWEMEISWNYIDDQKSLPVNDNDPVITKLLVPKIPITYTKCGILVETICPQTIKVNQAFHLQYKITNNTGSTTSLQINIHAVPKIVFSGTKSMIRNVLPWSHLVLDYVCLAFGTNSYPPSQLTATSLSVNSPSQGQHNRRLSSSTQHSDHHQSSRLQQWQQEGEESLAMGFLRLPRLDLIVIKPKLEKPNSGNTADMAGIRSVVSNFGSGIDKTISGSTGHQHSRRMISEFEKIVKDGCLDHGEASDQSSSTDSDDDNNVESEDHVQLNSPGNVNDECSINTYQEKEFGFNKPNNNNDDGDYGEEDEDKDDDDDDDTPLSLKGLQSALPSPNTKPTSPASPSNPTGNYSHHHHQIVNSRNWAQPIYRMDQKYIYVYPLEIETVVGDL